jgi:hypothetical protein
MPKFWANFRQPPTQIFGSEAWNVQSPRQVSKRKRMRSISGNTFHCEWANPHFTVWTTNRVRLRNLHHTPKPPLHRVPYTALRIPTMHTRRPILCCPDNRVRRRGLAALHPVHQREEDVVRACVNCVGAAFVLPVTSWRLALCVTRSG